MNEIISNSLTFYFEDSNPGIERENVVRHFLYSQPDTMIHDMGVIITNPIT